jgi:hypothetical protein
MRITSILGPGLTMGRIYTSFPWLDLELFSDHSLVI